jgi:hypothetical protein
MLQQQEVCPLQIIKKTHRNPILRGVNKFFTILAKLASSSVFLLAKSEINWPKI